MGIEPMMRVLQTHDLLLGKETFYQLNYTRGQCFVAVPYRTGQDFST